MEPLKMSVAVKGEMISSPVSASKKWIFLS